MAKVGDTINGYKLIKKLGAGTFGNVYEERKKRKAEEDLCVYHVISFYDAFLSKSKQYLYIVSVLIPGALSLNKFIKTTSEQKYKNRQDCTKAIIRGMVKVTESLKLLHKLKLVHRDLKPDNIMMTQRSAIIVDLGLSCLEEECKETAVGTPVYMAPELFKIDRGGRIRNFQALDIYALGSIFYEMTTGYLLNAIPAINDNDYIQKRIQGHHRNIET